MLVPYQHKTGTIRHKFQTSNTQTLLLLHKTMAEPVNAAVRRLDILSFVGTLRLNWIGRVNRMDKKVKGSRYRPGVAQRVGRGIALLFHDRGTGRG